MAHRNDETGIRWPLGQVDQIQMRTDRDHRPQKPQHLIDKMAAQIAQQPAVGAGLQCMGIVQIHPRMQPPQPAQPTAVQHPFQRADIGVASPVVKDGQHHALAPRRLVKLARGCGRGRKGLVGDDMQARFHAMIEEFVQTTYGASSRGQSDN